MYNGTIGDMFCRIGKKRLILMDEALCNIRGIGDYFT